MNRLLSLKTSISEISQGIYNLQIHLQENYCQIIFFLILFQYLKKE